MPPIPIPFTDAVLRLSLPFTGLPTGVRVLAAAGSVPVFLGLIFLLYRHELRLIHRRFATALLGLRVAVIAALFLTVTLDPVLARTVREEVPGRVLVAVDRSDSMRVTDPNRPLGEKLRIGQVLKLTTDLASEAQHDSWIRQAEGDGRVRFSTFGAGDEPDRYDRVVRRLNDTTRVTIATRVLVPDGLGLVDAIRGKHAVEVAAFGQDIVGVPTDPDRLAAALNPPAKPGGGAAYTDLKLPLARAAESAGDGPEGTGPKLLGVVVLTDGRHNWGESPVARAVELGQRKVPVYPVVIAPKEPPADVAVVSAQAQASTVFKGSIVPVEAGVRVTGWSAGKIRVTLAFPDAPDGGKRDPQVETIDHDGRDTTYPVTFKAKMDAPGPQALTVTAETAGDGPTDRFPENNRRTVRVNVVKDRAKVMLIDGEARWEFHYLHTCLGRDPNMDIRSVVFRQPRIGAVRDEDELRKTGTPARKLPDDPDVLTSYDCIVLGDVEPTQLTVQDRERIEKYVAEAGGTLVLTAGKRAMPLFYAGEDGDPLRKLLPIKGPRAFGSNDGFRLAITAEGEKSWFLAMGDGGVENRQAWGRMPPHHWAVVGEAKDAAEVLAALPGGTPRERAVIARQSYGFGRVLYVGVDSTWRWRFKAGDYFHHRFWGQVAQWAASDRLLPVTNAAGTIRFGTREPSYTGGQDVEVVVRTAEAVKKLGPNALKAARLIRLPAEAGGRETPAGLVPLTHPEGRPRDLSGKARELTPGKYAVELDIPEWADQLQGPPGPDGRSTKLRCTFEVLPPDNEELVDLAANLPLLEELAQASGGKVYTVATVHELLDALAAQTAVREYFVERPLRQSWWMFGIFITLLAGEWILRKWAGLP